MQPTYTAAEAAEYLGVSVDRVYDFLADGRLPSTKHGVAYVISHADLAAFAAVPRYTGQPRKTADKKA
jgi:excisionase family DNA binding protein